MANNTSIDQATHVDRLRTAPPRLPGSRGTRAQSTSRPSRDRYEARTHDDFCNCAAASPSDDLPTQVRKRMREVALLTFDGHLIASLREYWASEVVALSPAATPSSGTVTDQDLNGG